ncbi:MAG: hypothetical protein K6E75_03660 [Lachnospiraceae bacterium]|nr:hypothetical protein [Lachnospiraceae bacterium]
MNDRDKRVVESMFRSGMDKETVCSLFPQFDKSEIEAVGKALTGADDQTGDDAGAPVSINCS